MDSSRVYLLFSFVLSFHGITVDTNSSTKGGKNPTLAINDSFLGSASTSDQISRNQTCFPKPWNKLMDQSIENNCSSVKVLQCYCLTSVKSNNVDNGLLQYMTFGKCFYGCFDTVDGYRIELVEQLLDKGICAHFNRKSILCGQCKDGYGPAVYSFSLKCVECGNSTHWTRVPLYILIAYGPLTVFLGVIVVFTVSVNSTPLHGWILVCQILSMNPLMRILLQAEHQYIYVNHIALPLTYTIITVYAIWSLDFFRLFYTPFCLHPHLTTLQVMSLDYIIAAYPLVLIVVMYLLVGMYDRNCRPVVVMFRPFHFCFLRFRHQLDIRTSLVDAFGTFLNFILCQVFKHNM